jgi:tetratricopeptide (TPR) repeat protein
MLTAAPAAHGDQVVTADENHTKVTVSGYAEGDLHLRLADGSTIAVPLVEVRWMVVDTVGQSTDFNEAERALQQDQPQKAISRYERALRQATDYWPAIIRVRLLQACDRAGKFEQAVTHFLDVAADAPNAAARLMPTCAPQSRTPAAEKVLQRLSTEAKRPADPDRRVLLEVFRYAIRDRIDDRRTGEEVRRIARIAIPPPIGSAAVYAIKIAACRELADAGEHSEALAALDEAIAACPLDVMPDLLLLKGQTLLARSSGRRDLPRAGLAFMRVAIHFADDERAAEALFWAAKVHQRIERPDKAGQLWKECLAHARISPTIRDRAEAELARLANGQ